MDYHGKRLDTANKNGVVETCSRPRRGQGLLPRWTGLLGVPQGCWGCSNREMGTTEGLGDAGAHGA